MADPHIGSVPPARPGVARPPLVIRPLAESMGEDVGEELLALRARVNGEPVPVRPWQLEVERMIRQTRMLGFLMFPVIAAAAAESAKFGLWVNAISLSMSCGVMGFSLGLLTIRMHKGYVWQHGRRRS